MAVIQVNQWTVNDEPQISPGKAQAFFGDLSRDPLGSDRHALNIPTRKGLTVQQLLEICLLREWLALRPGVNSRAEFARYRVQKALLRLQFAKQGGDLDAAENRWRKRINDYFAQ